MSILRRRSLFAALTVAAVATLATAAAFAAAGTASVPRDGVLAFDIVRNGKPIGTHTYRFSTEGERTKVEIRTDISFQLLFIPVYRFEHESREIWENNRLTSLESSTNDNGTPVKLRVYRDEDSLMVIGEDGMMHVDREIIPASLWNRLVLDRNKLLMTTSGSVKSTQVEYVGEETVEVRGQPHKARHFRLTGQFSRDLWYDENDVLVRVRFEASDGSTVQYVPK